MPSCPAFPLPSPAQSLTIWLVNTTPAKLSLLRYNTPGEPRERSPNPSRPGVVHICSGTNLQFATQRIRGRSDFKRAHPNQALANVFLLQGKICLWVRSMGRPADLICVRVVLQNIDGQNIFSVVRQWHPCPVDTPFQSAIRAFQQSGGGDDFGAFHFVIAYVENMETRVRNHGLVSHVQLTEAALIVGRPRLGPAAEPGEAV